MSSNMDAPLSAYWVRFFKAAGFSPDVATRHAVVFSNNRIQPDMLPELDKPSLKEMGISLMGDMIAILRYAKKVVEETTCERFLVDSKDLVPSSKTQPKTTSPSVKKVVTKPSTTKVVTKPQVQQSSPKKIATKSLVVKKKLVPTRTISQSTEKPKPVMMKRKIAIDPIEIESDEEEPRKRVKIKVADDEVGYKVIMPKGTTPRSQTILKKAVEQKRTVFDRLGDSSVTSTTSSSEGSTTFNITGVGKPVFKRTINNVFNRLGDKDGKKEEQPYAGILKNGSASTSARGILKNRGPSIVSTTKKTIKKPVGTMRADFERKKKPIVTSTVAPLVSSTKLASERIKSVSAKQRLGVTKQVTFNKIATIAQVKKPDVFSRLGV